jgi:hypothetical protein
MLSRAITRRLFVVPLANNNHGKTTMIRSLVRQGERREADVVRRGPRTMWSPWGRSIDALIIPRSYQETLEAEFKTIEAALKGVDPLWRQRDLVVFPSHLESDDCETMLKLAHGAGFDAVAVAILLQAKELQQYQDCLELPWNERWTLSNDKTAKSKGQIEALGHDLWAWVAAALEHR